MFIALHKNAHDITGRRFGRLSVLGPVERLHVKGGTRILWLCRCDCGGETRASVNTLSRGHTTSCGCFHREQVAARETKHGCNQKGKRTPEYNIWAHVKGRCLNARRKDYRYYGARGIKLCDRWRDFANFIADMGPRPSPAHSLDRYPNNDGGYEPGNCRWATKFEQANNKRNNRLVTALGRTQTAAQWERERGWNSGVISNRLGHGWSEEDAATRPLTYRPGHGRSLTEQSRIRRAAQRRATPKWLTREQRKEMRAMKRHAGAMGREYHLDHIEPILGRLAMGLHVPWNLQITTAAENWSKNNQRALGNHRCCTS